MRPIKCALAIVILLLAQSAIANSAEDHIQLGLDALKRGDYGAAITLWRPRAEQGDIDAQFHLGHLHDQRWGVPQDYAEAAKWYRRAAEQGHARAQYNLGSMYEDGRGVARDDAAAVRLYCRAIRQNDPQALVKLGSMYGAGRGVAANDIRAHVYFNLAAKRGHRVAALERDVAIRRMAPGPRLDARDTVSLKPMSTSCCAHRASACER